MEVPEKATGTPLFCKKVGSRPLRQTTMTIGSQRIMKALTRDFSISHTGFRRNDEVANPEAGLLGKKLSYSWRWIAESYKHRRTG